MAPSEKILVEKLKSAVLSFFENDRDNLSVKKVRTAVESELDLDPGFFLSSTWKEKSKKIIVDHVEHLDSADEPEAKQPTPQRKKSTAAPPKKRERKPTAAEKSRPVKRQKKAVAPSDDEEQTESSKLSDLPDEESPASDFGDSDASESPSLKKTSGKTKTPVKGKGKQKMQVDSDDEEDAISEDSIRGDNSDAPPPKKTPRKKVALKKATPKKATPKKSVKANASNAKATKVEKDVVSEDGTSALTTPSDSDEPPKKKDKPISKPKEKLDDDESSKIEDAKKQDQANASESDMSIVLDEAPKPKRRRKTGSPKAPKSKAPKAAPAALSSTEEQIKTLQSHLVKCGIRKIWAFELKQFGSDSKAKTRHLQSMLKDAGMVGRFSESRAREIKEMRELQEELAAVKQGEKAWGLESGRASRSKKPSKSMKISSEEDEEDEGDGEGEVKRARKVVEDEEDDDSDGEPKARTRKPNNDLAFLGSESESD